MKIGKVIGNVWATRKVNNLNGYKFLIVELENGEKIVACDNIGAGEGDKVLVTLGSGARKGTYEEDVPIDSLVIGIIDEIEEGGGDE
ncbi:EutN/CcmL family microcompartment protein [Psychrilyobacter atlanticus]|uniref:EutN/CcmL family microcompartment protein n=1 Tax=Psychrilyobacter atlanticus TaxID=271091 RepID=UPI0003FCF89F|nr:EutN/CcmL family microcompartment protein [Psychrilyobacter atlanticus]